VQELNNDIQMYESAADSLFDAANAALEDAFEIMERRRELFNRQLQNRPSQHGPPTPRKRKDLKLSNICSICQRGEEEVSIRYAPSGCACLAFCSDCVMGDENDECLLNKLKKAALLASIDLLENEENEFDNLKFEEILERYPNLRDRQLKIVCPLCKKRLYYFVRHSTREPKKNIANTVNEF